MKQVTILGATGSIGQSTLDIIERHPDRFSLYALAANTSYEKMADLCRRYSPQIAVMGDADSGKTGTASGFTGRSGTRW